MALYLIICVDIARLLTLSLHTPHTHYTPHTHTTHSNSAIAEYLHSQGFNESVECFRKEADVVG